jgi:nitrogen fixation protein NifU and related proteins
MSDLRDLYQELIVDHGKHPRNFHHPAGANRVANGHNPLCGDRISVAVRVEDDRIVEIGFSGAGCAICMAAASTMTEAVKGRSLLEVQGLLQGFLGLVVEGKQEACAALPPKLGVFSGVCEFPVRVKCATLAWHTLDAALVGKTGATSEGGGDGSPGHR